MLNQQQLRTVSTGSHDSLSMHQQQHTSNDVVLTHNEWKKNVLFRKLIAQHASKLVPQEVQQVGILEHMAITIIQIWINQHAGRFFQYSSPTIPGGALHQLTAIPSIMERVHAILMDLIRGSTAAMVISTPGGGVVVAPMVARNITPNSAAEAVIPTQVGSMPDSDKMSCISTQVSPPFDENQDTNDDPFDDDDADPLELLSLVPHDIFDSLDLHLAAHPLSPMKQSNNNNKPRRVSLNMKPLAENQAFLEQLDFPGLAIASPSSKLLVPPQPTSEIQPSIKADCIVSTPSIKAARTVKSPSGKTARSVKSPSVKTVKTARTTKSPSIKTAAVKAARTLKSPVVKTDKPLAVKKTPHTKTPDADTPLVSKKRCAQSSLPLRKRFRKTEGTSVEINSSPVPAAAAVLPPKTAVHIEYNSGDVVFHGKAMRNHSGNQVLAKTIWRFTKNDQLKGDSDGDIIAMTEEIIALWSELGARFLEAKESSSTIVINWVDVEPTVLRRRIYIMIQESVSAHKDGKLTLLSNRCHKQVRTTKVPSKSKRVASKCWRVKVPILLVNVQERTIRQGQDCVLIDTTKEEKIEELTEHDVILGDNEGNHQMHLGNLKFLHHMDDNLVCKFERAKSMVGKLDVVRKLVVSWKKCCHINWKKGSCRFFAPTRTSSPTVYTSTQNELSIYLYIVRMLNHCLLPIPTGEHREVFLGDYWMVRRPHKRNQVYSDQIAASLDSYQALISNGSKTAETERSIVDEIILKTIGKDLSKERFRSYDPFSQSWNFVSFADAIQRTTMTLRLKAYFDGQTMGIFNFVKPTKETPRPIKSTVARKVKSNQDTIEDKVMTDSSADPPSLLQMQSTDSINVPLPPRRMPFVGRPGAKNPVSSDLQSAIRPSSPDPTFALLEEMLLSPESSNPEKEAALLQAGILSPNTSPSKSFVHKIPAISKFGQEPTCFVQPLAMRPGNAQPRAPACFLSETPRNNVFQPPPASWGPLGGIHHHRLMSQEANNDPTSAQEALPAFRSLNSPLNVILFSQQNDQQQMHQVPLLPRPVGTGVWGPAPVPPYSITNQQPKN